MSDAKSPSDLSMDEILKSIQRIIAEDERTSIARPAPPAPTASAAVADDVLELTEALNEDGTTRRLPPAGGMTAPIEPAAPSAVAERISAPTPREGAPPLREERIEPVVSGDIGVVSGGALAAAAAAATVEPEPAIERDAQATAPTASRSLEDLVSELLRPMLKTWLDENLPLVVERLARAEIARVAEKSGSSAG
jgi:cell pole-organizing protein PopZ